MKISFHGAAREVTGSCNLLEIEDKKILIDCGMFQGGKTNEEKNKEKFSFDARELDAVIVTHAHLDHVGRLPILIQDGFKGFFYATPATIDLANLILEDAFHIMSYDAIKFGRSVLYDESDIAEVMSRFKPTGYYKEHDLGGVTFKLHDAGHIFGAAFVEITGEGKKIVFSGDIGNVEMPILRETDSIPPGVDYIVCESTYGDRIHETADEREGIIQKAVVKALKKGGVLMIPAFSLERTQELLYYLNELIDRQKKIPRVPIFLDSPLAIKATQVFKKYPEYYDRDAKNLYLKDDDLFNFPGLMMTQSSQESKKINHTPSPKIIIAGSGMMTGGRILHHAIRYLSDRVNTLLIVGYQAYGTLGRDILEGKSPVVVMGERIKVKCRVKAIGALSAHGDQKKLMDWIAGGPNMPRQVFLNHGEPMASENLQKRLVKELDLRVTVAEREKEYKL